jgi:hypothetical protein
VIDTLELVARSVTGPIRRRPSSRSMGFGIDDIINLMSLDGSFLIPTTLHPDREEIQSSYLGYVAGAYERNGIVFAALASRYLLFSQVRFQFQQMRQGLPGNLFGTPQLSLLETPDDGQSTADLLARLMLDSDIAGIGYVVRKDGAIKRLRPDWTAAVFGSKRPDALPVDPDSKLLGFAYQPGGLGSGAEMMHFLPEEVAWFSTTPDGIRNIVGMSWLTPIMREITADSAATIHKLSYFRNAATPNLAVTLPTAMQRAEAEDWIELFEQEHRGASNAFRSMYFAGGATAQIVGTHLRNIDYRNVTAAGENRIAAAAMIHPVLLGTTDGLGGSALNQGNFQAAARWTADRFLYGAWGNAAGSLQRFIKIPNKAARLWYDIRRVPFLRDDVQSHATLIQAEATSMGSLIKDGFEPESVKAAVIAGGDWAQLVHTGLVSVQLQPPGTQIPARSAQWFHVARPRLHELLGEGWTPSTAADEAAIRSQATTPTISVGPARQLRAIDEFWPVSGPLATIGNIPAGTELGSDHALVREFPSMFEPIPERPGLIVTRADVVARRTALLASGQPAGVDALARDLNVSRETVRRRLRPEPSAQDPTQ